MPSRDPSQQEKFRFYACSPPLCASTRSPGAAIAAENNVPVLLLAGSKRTSSETSFRRDEAPQNRGRDGPRRAKSRKPLSGQIVKHVRQFTRHIDHDAVTAAHFDDLPSGDALIFLCEETKGIWIPIISKDENSLLDCLGSARKQDRHFKGSKRLRHTAPVYPIPPFRPYVEHFGGQRRYHAGMLFPRYSANAF